MAIAIKDRELVEKFYDVHYKRIGDDAWIHKFIPNENYPKGKNKISVLVFTYLTPEYFIPKCSEGDCFFQEIKYDDFIKHLENLRSEAGASERGDKGNGNC
jgi:hypothetical protein